jgi:hypothetical protein
VRAKARGRRGAGSSRTARRRSSPSWTVRTAFETYATDLDIGGLLDDAQVREFRNVANTLGQAVAELDAADLDAAIRTVGLAQNTAGTLLGDLDVPGLRYDPFHELLIECAD